MPFIPDRNHLAVSNRNSTQRLEAKMRVYWFTYRGVSLGNDSVEGLHLHQHTASPLGSPEPVSAVSTSFSSGYGPKVV